MSNELLNGASQQSLAKEHRQSPKEHWMPPAGPLFTNQTQAMIASTSLIADHRKKPVPVKKQVTVSPTTPTRQPVRPNSCFDQENAPLFLSLKDLVNYVRSLDPEVRRKLLYGEPPSWVTDRESFYKYRGRAFWPDKALERRDQSSESTSQ